MKAFIINILIKLSGNKFAQTWLERFNHLNRMLLGYGSGSFPELSGEKVVFDLLVGARANGEQQIIVFDVGANTGQYLQLVLDNLSGEQKQVFCFEPVSKPFNELYDSFHQNSVTHLENIGFDNSDHKSEIFYDAPGSLRASKYQRNLEHLGVSFSLSETVNFTTIDAYCKDHKITYIDLLKIDVEGNELNVLRGAEGLLAGRNIRFITFEFSRAHVDSKTFFKDIYLFLKKFGLLNLYRIHPTGYLIKIEKYDEKYEMFFPTNYLAVMEFVGDK